MTVVAYTQAIVMGTLTSRTSLKRGVGIVMGGAMVEDPAGGGGRVEGSLFGGNLKREEEGSVRKTSESSILLVGYCVMPPRLLKCLRIFQDEKIPRQDLWASRGLNEKKWPSTTNMG
jgi:hypothetical protein